MKKLVFGSCVLFNFSFVISLDLSIFFSSFLEGRLDLVPRLSIFFQTLFFLILLSHRRVRFSVATTEVSKFCCFLLPPDFHTDRRFLMRDSPHSPLLVTGFCRSVLFVSSHSICVSRAWEYYARGMVHAPAKSFYDTGAHSIFLALCGPCGSRSSFPTAHVGVSVRSDFLPWSRPSCSPLLLVPPLVFDFHSPGYCNCSLA
jgi:hypothetical protein